MILLDTHAWLWLALDPGRLSSGAARAIRRALREAGLAVASISLWEVAMLIARGRVVPQGTPEVWLASLVEHSRVVVKEITPAIAVLAAHLPVDFPGDPADRVIAATARVEGLRLVTRDARLRASHLVETVW